MNWDEVIEREMHCCRLCPRECGADRTKQPGLCGVPDGIIAARAALHFWEEPCISGKNGSGAVFFTGCGLKCIYCQNGQISGTDRSCGRKPGRELSVQKLASIFLRLQEDQHANNINLVTAAQYIPQTAAALSLARELGLRIPVVYNSSGYEKASSLRMLEGLVDVWLPDFKYMDPEMARQYSHAPDYPERAKEAVAEMVRQAELGQGTMFYEKDGQQLMGRGVIVRHLLLPGHVKNAKAVVSYLHETYGSRIFISMMNQYTPMAGLQGDPLLGRKVTKREYERLVDYAVGIGVENGFIQEGGTARESFIPSWNGEGID